MALQLKRRLLRLLQMPALGALALCILWVGFPEYAHAAAPVCIDDLSGANNGLKVISDVAKNLTRVMDGLSQAMFQGVAAGLSDTVKALVELYIVIYGILFMFGATSVTLYDFIRRLVTVAIVAMLFGSPLKMYGLLQSTFETGMDQLLNVVAGGGASSNTDPLASVDALVSALISPKTMATLSAIGHAGPQGWILGGIMLLNVQVIGKAILNAVWIYLMSKIVRILLLGLAPIFIACFLFQQTRSYFNGWLNQLISVSLQPIFLFAFFVFFSNILVGVIHKISSETPACISPVADAGRGAPTQTYKYIYKKPDGTTNEGTIWGFDGPVKEHPEESNSKIFPISMFNILVFLILAELAGRFNSIAVSLANGIAGASTNLANMSAGFAVGFGGGVATPPKGSGAAKQHTEEASKMVGNR